MQAMTYNSFENVCLLQVQYDNNTDTEDRYNYQTEEEKGTEYETVTGKYSNYMYFPPDSYIPLLFLCLFFFLSPLSVFCIVIIER